MGNPEILIVDDDAFFRAFCADALRIQGHAVRAVTTGREALEALEAGDFSLILADIYMPEMSGLELLETVKARSPALDVVIMTGYASIETAVRALKQGAADYLRKPFAAEELFAVVDATLARRRLYQENEHLKSQLRLYEISRSFASVEDPTRVLGLGLEALTQVTRAEAGISLFNHAGMRFMEVEAQRGLTLAQAQAVREAFVRHGATHLQELLEPATLGASRLNRILGSAPVPRYRELLMLPLLDRGSPAGAFLMFREAGGVRFSAEEVEGGQFVSRQVELSHESARRVQEARDLAFIDPLTDLHNARYLNLTLEKRIAEADHLGTPFSVLFMDLDYFKEINDSHGHLTGGKVLIEVSRILKANVRDEDTVIRYGGDEFTLILPNTGLPGARDVAERIRKAIKEHVFLGREGKFIRLTASIGVACYPDDADSREDLIEQADRAMYRGKEATRDVVYAARAD